MKTIIKIGYSHFLLPKSVNVNALLTALHDATPVEYDIRDNEIVWYHKSGPSRGDSEIEIKLVKDGHFIDAKKRKAIPQKASEDANGKDITKPEEALL